MCSHRSTMYHRNKNSHVKDKTTEEHNREELTLKNVLSLLVVNKMRIHYLKCNKWKILVYDLKCKMAVDIADIWTHLFNVKWTRICLFLQTKQKKISVSFQCLSDTGINLIRIKLILILRRAERFHWISPKSFKKISQWTVMVKQNNF